MDWKTAATTFGLVFLAEMGDKTQLAAISMVGKTGAPWAVFLGASLALCLVSLLGVFVGMAATRWVPPWLIERAAALAFIAIGVVMLVRGD